MPQPSTRDEVKLADATALATLERRPATLLRATVSAVVWMSERESNAPAAAHPLVVRNAERLGFRHVGQRREGLTPLGILTDVWVAEDETAYLLGTQSRSRDPIVKGLSHYFIFTFFDDCTYVETLASSDAAVEETEGAVQLRGTDSLATDWATHRAAIAKHCTQRNCRVIPVRDLATVTRLARLRFRQLVSASTAKILLAMFAAMCAAFFTLLALLLRLVLH